MDGIVRGHLWAASEWLERLVFVGAVMALANPNILWDVSFQLSFMATLGLVLFAGLFTEAFRQAADRWWGADWARRLSGPVGEYILYTLAAQLTILPVILAQFERTLWERFARQSPDSVCPALLILLPGSIAGSAGPFLAADRPEGLDKNRY